MAPEGDEDEALERVSYFNRRLQLTANAAVFYKCCPKWVRRTILP